MQVTKSKRLMKFGAQLLSSGGRSFFCKATVFVYQVREPLVHYFASRAFQDVHIRTPHMS